MTARPRSPFRRPFVLCALLLASGAAISACQHAAVRARAPGVAASDPCEDRAAASRGVGTPGCTPAQRICLLVHDVSAAVAAPDFVPEASYASSWQSHVAGWRIQLSELLKEAPLETAVLVIQRKLELLGSSEHDRRLIVENGDLLFVLRVLTEKAAAAQPGLGPSCALPP